MFDVLFVDVRHFLDNSNSLGFFSRTSFRRNFEPIYLFYSVINGVNVFGKFLSENFEMLLNFASFLIFVYLLPSFIIDRSRKKLSVPAESAIEHIFMAIVRLYESESVFCQVLIDFFCCLFVVLFVTA